MKLLLGVLLISMPFSIMAKSWRVNSNLSANADFSSLQNAHDDLKVYDGDTLYIEPGTSINTTVNISKGLTIIGPGYSSTENNSIYGNNEVFIHTLNISAQNNMKYFISGLNCENIAANLQYGNNISETVIERCKVSNISGANTVIRNCIIKNSIGNRNNINTYYLGNIIYNPTATKSSMICGQNNAVFKNNTIIVNYNGKESIEYTYGFSVYFVNSTFTNNIIININPDSYIESQNTFYYKDKTLSFDVNNNNIYENNIFSTSTPEPKYPNNKWGYSIEDIFALEETAEGYWKLKEGSPAKGFGINGEDCGAFGGEYPFVIGGAPKFMPTFYDINIPSKAIDGKLSVKLKIKVQDE